MGKYTPKIQIHFSKRYKYNFYIGRNHRNCRTNPPCAEIATVQARKSNRRPTLSVTRLNSLFRTKPQKQTEI